MRRDPAEILRDARTIAVVGASPDPAKPSHGVMRYLLGAGYRCVPVNPRCGEVLGVPAVASLAEMASRSTSSTSSAGPSSCAAHAREAVEAGAAALWLQLGIVSAEARRITEEAGLDYVENACTAVVHAARLR